jgi:hypothetical protein
MFPLHDHTRRQICIALFFLLGVVPTAAVAVWAVAWHLPWHVQSEAERLGRELGVDVAIDGLRHSRPGVVIYEGLKLSDPETRQSILRCRQVEATWTTMTGSQGEQRSAIVLAMPQVEIETAEWTRLSEIVQRRLQGQGGRPEIEVRVAADEVTLRWGESVQGLTHFEGGIGVLPGGIQAQAAFHLAGTTPAEPIRVRMVRNRQVTPPANGFELNTGSSEVPCRLLALAIPELNSLGPDCRYSGNVWSNQSPDGLEGEMAGRWLGVDLGGLISGHFSHKLSCTAEVAIQRARFRQGRLEEVAGVLMTGPGLIGRGLLDAAADRLRLVRSLQPAAAEVMPFDCLAFEFAVDAEGIRLAGRCPGPERGTVLAVASGRLLGEPNFQPLPTAALLQALAPAGTIQVPAGRQIDWLARLVPTPEVVPTAGTAGARIPVER